MRSTEQEERPPESAGSGGNGVADSGVGPGYPEYNTAMSKKESPSNVKHISSCGYHYSSAISMLGRQNKVRRPPLHVHGGDRLAGESREKNGWRKGGKEAGTAMQAERQSQGREEDTARTAPAAHLDLVFRGGQFFREKSAELDLPVVHVQVPYSCNPY